MGFLAGRSTQNLSIWLWGHLYSIWSGGCGDLGRVGSIPGACRRPDAAGDLGKLCGDLGTSIVSGLGVVGIWAGSGSIPGACRRPDAAGDLGSPELAGHL